MILSETLNYFFSECNSRKVNYCVLRNYQDFPDRTGNDIDILIGKEDIKVIDLIFEELSKRSGWDLVFKKKREFHYCYQLGQEGEPSTLNFDFQTDFAYYGNKYLKSEFMLAQRRKFANFYIPPKGAEAVVLLLHSLLFKHSVKKKYRDLILISRTGSEKEFDNYLYQVLGKRLASSIISFVVSEAWDDLFRYRQQVVNKIRFSRLGNIFSEMKCRIINQILKLRVFKHEG